MPDPFAHHRDRARRAPVRACYGPVHCRRRILAYLAQLNRPVEFWELRGSACLPLATFEEVNSALELLVDDGAIVARDEDRPYGCGRDHNTATLRPATVYELVKELEREQVDADAIMARLVYLGSAATLAEIRDCDRLCLTREEDIERELRRLVRGGGVTRSESLESSRDESGVLRQHVVTRYAARDRNGGVS